MTILLLGRIMEVIEIGPESLETAFEAITIPDMLNLPESMDFSQGQFGAQSQ